MKTEGQSEKGMKMKRTRKITKQEADRIAKRNQQLAAVHEAIKQGRAYIDHELHGRMNITSYDDLTQWAGTPIGSEPVELDDIKIG